MNASVQPSVFGVDFYSFGVGVYSSRGAKMSTTESSPKQMGLCRDPPVGRGKGKVPFGQGSAPTGWCREGAKSLGAGSAALVRTHFGRSRVGLGSLQNRWGFARTLQWVEGRERYRLVRAPHPQGGVGRVQSRWGRASPPLSAPTSGGLALAWVVSKTDGALQGLSKGSREGKGTVWSGLRTHRAVSGGCKVAGGGLRRPCPHPLREVSRWLG